MQDSPHSHRQKSFHLLKATMLRAGEGMPSTFRKSTIDNYTRSKFFSVDTEERSYFDFTGF